MKKIGFLVLILISALFLNACNTSNNALMVYDNDNLIVNGGSSMTYGSVSTINNSKASYKAQSISGAVTLFSQTYNDNPDITLELTVTDGDCKVVMIKNQTVYVIAEGNYNGTVTMPVEAGKYTVKIVGKSACISLVINR